LIFAPLLARRGMNAAALKKGEVSHSNLFFENITPPACGHLPLEIRGGAL